MHKDWDPLSYIVKKGDTLYSIAWRYEKDYRQVAQFNNIQPPYAIFPGQHLHLDAADKNGTTTETVRPQVLTEPDTGQTIVIEEPVPVADVIPPVIISTNIATKKSSLITVQKNDTLYSIARREGYTHHQLARWNHLRSPYVLKPGQVLRLSPTAQSLGMPSTTQTFTSPDSIAAVKPVTKPLIRDTIKVKPLAPPVSKKSLPVKVDRWNWPVTGKVVKTYKANEPSRKGIGISGKSGQSVKAAAGGTVVYSGNGLINYGNLIIIKHSHSYLSAYAYNQSLLVKEGDSVKRGQSIAKMGLVNSRPQLHFEIRRNGKPVNPLHFLPKS